jgi:hypothetical protein
MLLRWMILRTLRDSEGMGVGKRNRGMGVSLDEKEGSELCICNDETMELRMTGYHTDSVVVVRRLHPFSPNGSARSTREMGQIKCLCRDSCATGNVDLRIESPSYSIIIFSI